MAFFVHRGNVFILLAFYVAMLQICHLGSEHMTEQSLRRGRSVHPPEVVALRLAFKMCWLV
jgi:hypothetical protein